MVVPYCIVILSHIIWSVEGFLYFPPIDSLLDEYPEVPSDNLYGDFSEVNFVSGDAGEPLFLTSYIQSGNAAQGKALARVSLTDELNITSYSRYITVNEQYDSNMFFWYFPAMAADQKKAPVVVWLQGGPGTSSMIGLFLENGPLTIADEVLVRKETTWASSHHMIYIDNPVGTGFSFTNDTRGYCTDEVQVGEQLHNMLTQFLKIFPEILENEFYACGDSYAGKYVPALGYTIHNNNPTAEVKINLKGLAIGNGWTDPENMMDYDKYLYQLGIIDWNQAQNINKLQDEILKHLKEKEYNETLNSYRKFLDIVSRKVNLYNYLEQTNKSVNSYDVDSFLIKSPVRKAIHVGKESFKIMNTDVYLFLLKDLFDSMAPWLSELLDHYSVMTYNGQLDIIVAYPLTVNYLRKLNFTGAEEYKTAPRYEWTVDGEIAGFVKQAGRLTEVMVRAAGHNVPLDQPKWALDLITRFTHNQPFH